MKEEEELRSKLSSCRNQSCQSSVVSCQKQDENKEKDDERKDERAEMKEEEDEQSSKLSSCRNQSCQSSVVSCQKEDESKDPALESIREMVESLGAERVLELIRDNRNAAIEQILSELKEGEENEPMRSGLSVEPKYHSIFDLASFA